MYRNMLEMTFCVAVFATSAAAQTAGPISAIPLTTGSQKPVTTQGGYATWNDLTGYLGETDFINNQGGGAGGFAFMNTPSSGTPNTTLMFLNGYGELGIGTSSPISALTLAGGGNPNPNTGSQINYPGESLTFVNNVPTGAYELGGIRMVQPTGYYLDRGNMVFTVGTGSAATLDAVTIQSPTGNVGIGTTSPGYMLDVAGAIRSSSGGVIFPDGTTQTTAWTGVLCGGDYAEAVDVGGDLRSYGPGDVLVIASSKDDDVEKASEPYSTRVVGIYATKPGVIGKRQELAKNIDTVPMAMVGIVPTKVSAENGPIRKGDLLVTSSTPGYAMKGTDRSRMLGAVIGKALGSLDSETGVIEVVVTPQ